MKTRSTLWDAAIVQPHQIAVDVRAMYNRQVVTGPLALVAGTVTLDRTAAQLGRFDGKFAEPTLIPAPTSPLSPFGYELVVKRGIYHADLSVELVSLGVFPIQKSTTEGLTLSTSVSAMDRSQLVKDARLEDDYQVAIGTNYATAIHDLIDAGVPGLSYVFETVAYTTPLLTFAAQDDRWDRAREMSKSCGCELFFDGIGALILRKEPSFSTTPVWAISEGPNGVMIGADLWLDRGPAFNRVIATGQNSSLGFVPRGVWTDTLAGSPSGYTSGFGKKPKFYSSEFITTDAQALDAATSIGIAQQGIARSLDLSLVPNPALEPGDVATITRQAMGVRENYLLDSVVIGLAADIEMTAQARAQIGTATTLGGSVSINAGVATGTGTANDVNSTNAEAATGTGTANDAGGGRTPTTATGVGTANDATVTHVP